MAPKSVKMNGDLIKVPPVKRPAGRGPQQSPGPNVQGIMGIRTTPRKDGRGSWKKMPWELKPVKPLRPPKNRDNPFNA